MLGSQKEPFKFLVDTGSTATWVFSRYCKNAFYDQKKFDERQSSTFSFMSALLDLHYGSGSVYGYLSRDQMCLTDDKCSKDFAFINAVYQDGMGFDPSGIVGMSPKPPHLVKLGYSTFLDRLRETKTIDQGVFSLFISLKQNQSKILYGGYDLSRFAAPSQSIQWHNLTGTLTHWSLELGNLVMTSGSH